MDIRDKIHNRVRNLPTLPTVFSTLSDAMSNPMSTTEDIAEIIASDQASSLKVLRVANSPFYGFSGKIDTISRAILHLGFREVQNIVLALSIINLFSKNKLLVNFRPVDFWAHSIGTGVATRLIGIEAGVTNIDNFFIAGILHDIGKLLFFDHFEKEYAKVLRLVEEENYIIEDAEKEILGMSHAEAGWVLSERWKLPLSIKNAIYHHHKGFINGRTDQLTASVHIGNITARMLELGYPGDDFVTKPNKEVWSYLNLSKDFFTRIELPLIQHYEESVQLLLYD